MSRHFNPKASGQTSLNDQNTSSVCLLSAHPPPKVLNIIMALKQQQVMQKEALKVAAHCNIICPMTCRTGNTYAVIFWPDNSYHLKVCFSLCLQSRPTMNTSKQHVISRRTGKLDTLIGTLKCSDMDMFSWLANLFILNTGNNWTVTQLCRTWMDW